MTTQPPPLKAEEIERLVSRVMWTAESWRKPDALAARDPETEAQFLDEIAVTISELRQALSINQGEGGSWQALCREQIPDLKEGDILRHATDGQVRYSGRYKVGGDPRLEVKVMGLGTAGWRMVPFTQLSRWTQADMSHFVPARLDDNAALRAELSSERQEREKAEGEVARLRGTLAQVKRILTIPAAEYVPAIPDAWAVIDEALR